MCQRESDLLWIENFLNIKIMTLNIYYAMELHHKVKREYISHLFMHVFNDEIFQADNSLIRTNLVYIRPFPFKEKSSVNI